MKVQINHDAGVTKIDQVVQAIVTAIERGKIKPGERLTSIKAFSIENKIAKDTVEKAYNILKQQRYIAAVKGKGNYVLEYRSKALRVLLMFNKLSSYKKVIYEAMVRTFGKKAKVDLAVHHYDPKIVEEIIGKNEGQYDYYVLMPHFFEDVNLKHLHAVLATVPPDQLVFLDKDLSTYKESCLRVYQDFKQDVYEALGKQDHLIIPKYKELILVFPPDTHHPPEIIDGMKIYCAERKLKFNQISSVDMHELKKEALYIVLTEDDLGYLLKKIRLSDYFLGADIGLISFNETVLKELLDITVMTTDFDLMGERVAMLMLAGKQANERNTFKTIIRGSL